MLSKLELEVSFDVVDEMACNLIEEYALHISMDHELTFYELFFDSKYLTRLKKIRSEFTVNIYIDQSGVVLNKILILNAILVHYVD